MWMSTATRRRSIRARRPWVGLVAVEGDLGTSGDSATLNAGTPHARTLTNATNPANNFFNASISSRTGTSVTQKRPNYLNQFGFDADIFDATGFLANGQTSTTLRLATSGDGFAPDGVSFATDLFAPSLRVTKSVDKTQADLGDELTYTVGVSNTGLDAATNLIMRDAIPPGTTFVPGSIAVVDGANAGPKTDQAGDDQAEYDAAGNALVLRLGDGADAADGGRLPINGTTSFRFKVKIADQLALGSRIVNSASAGYTAETLDRPGAVTSPDVVTSVRVPDLAIAKSHTGEFRSGRSVPFTVIVSNVGDGASRGLVTVTDTLDPDVHFATDPAGDGWSCSHDARSFTCTRSDALAPNAAFPAISYVGRVDADAPEGTLENTAVVANAGDGNELNNSDTNVGENHHPAIDLAIEKLALTPIGLPGREVRFRLRVANLGPDTATDVRVRDTLPAGLTAVSVVPSRGTCAGTVCRLGRMRRGAQATIAITALAADDTGGRRLRDSATVSGHEDELTLDNNTDSATVRIIRLVDIIVEKTPAAPTVPAGSNVTFTVVVSNAGPSDATGVVFADRLPPELTGISATPTQGTCPTPTRCLLGNIAAGGAAQIIMVARPDPAAVGQPLTNVVVALAPQPDINLSNNLARAT
jgi:uncharacterized repeat protein (TIGR01451 family)